MERRTVDGYRRSGERVIEDGAAIVEERRNRLGVHDRRAGGISKTSSVAHAEVREERNNRAILALIPSPAGIYGPGHPHFTSARNLARSGRCEIVQARAQTILVQPARRGWFAGISPVHRRNAQSRGKSLPEQGACGNQGPGRVSVLIRLGTSPTGIMAVSFLVRASIAEMEAAPEFET